MISYNAQSNCDYMTKRMQNVLLLDLITYSNTFIEGIKS